MPEVHVQFESLAQGQEGIRANYAKLQSTLEGLEQGLAPMVNEWSGTARDQYMVCKKQWDDAAAALALTLNSISQAVGQAHENYTGAEQAATNNWS